MPAKGQRLLGENLVNVTFKIPESALDTIDQHHRTLQRMNRWQRINKSDCLRDIFMRAIDALENPPQQFPVHLDAPQLPLPTPAALSAGGAIPPAATGDATANAVAAIERAIGRPIAACVESTEPPTPAYEAQVMTPEAFPEPPLEEEPEDRPRARRVAVPQDEEIENMPLVPTAAVETVNVPGVSKTARPKAAAKRKTPRTTKAKGR